MQTILVLHVCNMLANTHEANKGDNTSCLSVAAVLMLYLWIPYFKEKILNLSYVMYIYLAVSGSN